MQHAKPQRHQDQRPMPQPPDNKGDDAVGRAQVQTVYRGSGQVDAPQFKHGDKDNRQQPETPPIGNN
jgi:hypothetical protein